MVADMLPALFFIGQTLNFMHGLSARVCVCASHSLFKGVDLSVRENVKITLTPKPGRGDLQSFAQQSSLQDFQGMFGQPCVPDKASRIACFFVLSNGAVQFQKPLLILACQVETVLLGRDLANRRIEELSHEFRADSCVHFACRDVALIFLPIIYCAQCARLFWWEKTINKHIQKRKLAAMRSCSRWLGKFCIPPMVISMKVCHKISE